MVSAPPYAMCQHGLNMVWHGWQGAAEAEQTILGLDQFVFAPKNCVTVVQNGHDNLFVPEFICSSRIREEQIGHSMKSVDQTSFLIL